MPNIIYRESPAYPLFYSIAYLLLPRGPFFNLSLTRGVVILRGHLFEGMEWNFIKEYSINKFCWSSPLSVQKTAHTTAGENHLLQTSDRNMGRHCRIPACRPVTHSLRHNQNVWGSDHHADDSLLVDRAKKRNHKVIGIKELGIWKN